MIFRDIWARRSGVGSRELGDVARDRRDWRSSAEHYRKYLKKNPNDADVWVQLGHALKESGRIDLAKRAYFRSLSINPEIADAHLQLGHLEKLRSRPDAALLWYKRAREIDPNCALASSDLRACEEAFIAKAGSNKDSAIPTVQQLNSFVGRVTALEERLRHFDDFAAAVKAMGVELQSMRRQNASVSESVTQLERKSEARFLEHSQKLDGVEQRLADVDDMPVPARERISALFAHYQNVGDLDIEVKQQRSVLEQLQRKFEVS